MLEVTIFTKDGKELKRYELVGQRPLTVGRGTVCDIQVPLMDVSRQHATLEPDGENSWVLRDNDSTHGCVLKGERKRSIDVRAGLEVRLGSARMRFTNLADRIGEELNQLLADADPNAETADAVNETVPRLVISLAETTKPQAPDAGQPATAGKRSWRLRWAS
jgi:pSer/pThr/pTyr-binding forkhead associated (FHA) protein